MKPIIGISADCRCEPENERTGGKVMLNWNYCQAISEAGGVPVIIPPNSDMAALAKVIDGWLIPGGEDIDAARFGEENHPAVELQDPARFEAEARLYAELPSEIPVLGICYGCQFLNVVRGGSLIQHLPDVVNHNSHAGGTVQTYAVDPNSALASATGASAIDGKSFHHQAVGKVGSGLAVTAHSDDGTVEAIEATDRPWMVGVQWHPERSLEDPTTRRLFQTFVSAAAKHAESKRLATV